MRLAKYKGLIGLAVGIGLYALFLQLSGIHCPIKYLLGISCPGCGMSRACISALRLDFAAAFFYHPLWFMVLPFAVLAGLLHHKRKSRSLLVCVMLGTALLLAVYTWRMIFSVSDLVVFAPQNGLIWRAFRALWGSST